MATSNYGRYRRAAFNHPEHYPLQQHLAPEQYRPVADWLGRLVLPTPEQRSAARAVQIELYHAPAPYQHLVGQLVALRWSDDPLVQKLIWGVTRNVHFNCSATEYLQQGYVLPERLDGWQLVNPLESLAGAHPYDDVVVSLREPLVVEDSLLIRHEPVQVTGRFYALVRFVEPLCPGSEYFRVRHFNRVTGDFDGPSEVVRVPQVQPDGEGLPHATAQGLEHSPANTHGWYIYGAHDHSGLFVVQSLAPRGLLRLQPERVIQQREAGWRFVRHEAWAGMAALKGNLSSVLVNGPAHNLSQWQAGDRALVLHLYGGIGGSMREPAARSIYWGHFAFGLARVVREPLANELCFEIVYHQVYTHNSDGVTSGAQSWAHYTGDRQWGVLGARPVCDILVRLDAFDDEYTIAGQQHTPLDFVERALLSMTARYRIGDGKGATYIGLANNCAQDSCQSLYSAIRLLDTFGSDPVAMRQQLQLQPNQEQRFQQLVALGGTLQRTLLPFGRTSRSDWAFDADALGTPLADNPLRNVARAVASWRTIMPRMACETLARAFLDAGASLWVLRSVQVGGAAPDIEPVTPVTFP